MRITQPIKPYRWAAMVALLLTAGIGMAGSVVRLNKTSEGWQLRYNDKPYAIKGVGYTGRQGTEYLDQLVKAGGNSLRTWSVDQLSDSLLDQAQQRGLTVAVGIWLAHPRHGFDYTDPDSLARQKQQVRQAVERYKDHPAVLLWGLGNEVGMEGPDPDIYRHIEDLAGMVKQIDKNHPVMTVLAELGPRDGSKIKMIHDLCPSVDILGINSYAGIQSVYRRYVQAGGTKPYIITEHGPRGHWEVKKAWGTPVEESSTQKARRYRDGYTEAVLDHPDLALGAYTFLWGQKQETTATWYGMFLKDGTRLGAVDAMTRLWSGQPPANQAPLIDTLAVDKEVVPAGGTVTAEIKASDPDNDQLTYEWFLRPANMTLGTGGDFEQDIRNVKDAIADNTTSRVTVRVPDVKTSKPYRLFAYVRDGHGNGAVQNVVLLVQSDDQQAETLPAPPMPLVIYDETASQHYVPSGYMGNSEKLTVDQADTENPHAGQTCIKITYAAPAQWAGVVWQSPANNWGEVKGGCNLSNAKKLTFWARGQKGGEEVDFLCGLLSNEALYGDTVRLKESRTLSSQWKQYTFDLAGKDRTQIISGFGIVVRGTDQPVTFYLDDIQYE